eukprot:6212963-Pleurochrysis_carterae.AAC.1
MQRCRGEAEEKKKNENAQHEPDQSKPLWCAGDNLSELQLRSNRLFAKAACVAEVLGNGSLISFIYDCISMHYARIQFIVLCVLGVLSMICVCCSVMAAVLRYALALCQ